MNLVEIAALMMVRSLNLNKNQLSIMNAQRKKKKNKMRYHYFKTLGSQNTVMPKIKL